jgi:hypothetical protein
VSITLGKNRNLAVKLSGAEGIARIEQIARPFSVYVPGLAGIAKSEAFVAYGYLLRAVARGDANLVLRNVLYHLSRKQNSAWQGFTSAFQRIFPRLSVGVSFNPQEDEIINVEVEQDGRSIPLDCAGTSVLQTVQILSYIFLFEPEVTLLDEPDSHLHPDNQRALATLLCDLAAAGKTQIVLATHSRHILDVLKDRHNAHFVWCQRGSIRSTQVGMGLLTDLGALDSAEGLLTGGVELVVLTEDGEVGMFRTLLLAHGVEQGKYQIWPYKGCTRQDVALTLARFIHDVSPSTRVIVHRDCDYLQSDDMLRVRRVYEGAGLRVFLTPGVDVESLFCRLEHLEAVNPGHEVLIRTLHAAALHECVQEFRKKAISGLEEVDHQRHKLGLPTMGKVAISDLVDKVDITSERWRHGKILLRKLRQRFQEESKENLVVERPSQHLKESALTSLLAEARLSKP